MINEINSLGQNHHQPIGALLPNIGLGLQVDRICQNVFQLSPSLEGLMESADQYTSDVSSIGKVILKRVAWSYITGCKINQNELIKIIKETVISHLIYKNIPIDRLVDSSLEELSSFLDDKLEEYPRANVVIYFFGKTLIENTVSTVVGRVSGRLVDRGCI